MTRLTIAIPSKGRLKDNAETWLGEAGFKLRQKGGDRGYAAELKGLPDADVLLLSAREIAEGLLSGAFHIGITGEDLLHDLSADLDRDAHVIRRLGFGGADVVVAVPAAWLDVNTMADLEAAGAAFRLRHGHRMRVATKYLRLTRRFFASRSVGEYRMVESAGATEAAPNSGTAEVIVDITSTGATLKANSLKVLDDGVMLESQAALAGSLRADWSEEARATLRMLLDSVEARDEGAGMMLLRASSPIPDAAIESLHLQRAGDLAALCESARARDVARTLAGQGLAPVAISPLSFVFNEENEAYQLFVTKLTPTG